MKNRYNKNEIYRRLKINKNMFYNKKRLKCRASIFFLNSVLNGIRLLILCLIFNPILFFKSKF